jgi:ParB/RepB/Spo0J family partition protein
MTAPAAQWQLDRLSTSAREAAETASLGAGISLSAWLTKLINETCSAEGVASRAEPPKILEFTREFRVPSTPRLQPAPLPMPAPTLSVVPVSAYRPQPIPPAPIQQVPAQPPMQQQTMELPQAAPVALPPIASAPSVMPPPFGAPQAFAQPAPIAASHAVDATMLAVAAMVAANLGTRHGDDIPNTLLADVATRGVCQPVTVRRSTSNSEQYEIVCGHRRWRAAQRVGLAQIPAIVVAQDDATAILASLTENLQLNNLSAIDEAQAYLRLLTQYAIDVSVVTAAIGRDRKHIVQNMRLLGLPPLVRHLIGSGVLSREHAFVLLDAPQPEALADAILTEHLSVEAARQRIAAGAEGKP